MSSSFLAFTLIPWVTSWPLDVAQLKSAKIEFLGAVLWCLGISVVIRWGRRWIHPRMFRLINALCGLALGYFGIRVLWITIQDWLEHQVWPVLKPTR